MSKAAIPNTENCTICDGCSVAEDGCTSIDLSLVKYTVAVLNLLGSSLLVAVTCIRAGGAVSVGGVKTPLLLKAPPPLAVQVTDFFDSSATPVTSAVNCCCC